MWEEHSIRSHAITQTQTQTHTHTHTQTLGQIENMKLLLFFFVWRQGPSWPGTHGLGQARLELTKIPHTWRDYFSK